VARRGVDIDSRCLVCLRLDEDCGHLFFKCKKVKSCWRLLNLENVGMELELKQFLSYGSLISTCNLKLLFSYGDGGQQGIK
jgi:hypothetical protein